MRFQYTLVCGEPRVKKLGISLHVDPQRQCWVDDIDTAEGLVAEKNRGLAAVHHGQPEISATQLLVNDRITSVNGHEDADAILLELQNKALIHIAVSRDANFCIDPLPAAEVQPTVEASNSTEVPSPGGLRCANLSVDTLPATDVQPKNEVSSSTEVPSQPDLPEVSNQAVEYENTQQTGPERPCCHAEDSGATDVPVPDGRSDQWTSHCFAKVVRNYEPFGEPETGYLKLTCGDTVEVQGGTLQPGDSGPENKTMFESYVFATKIKDGQTCAKQDGGWVPTDVLRQL